MIVSHKHKFIFIHCRKVAGSSMKVALAPFLGECDLVVGSANEIIRAGYDLPAKMQQILSGWRCRGYSLAAKTLGKPAPEASNIALKKHFITSLGKNPPHPTAEAAARFAGPAWDQYVKFCFVRNPYTQVISDYLWRQRSTGKRFKFGDFLVDLERRDASRGYIHPNGTTNWEMMAVGDRLVVDFVGRYESLVEDFEKVASRVGLAGAALAVPQKVGSYDKSMGDYYQRGDRERVERIFGKEIDFFNYAWPFEERR